MGFPSGAVFRRSGKRECVKARKLEKAFRFGAGRIKVLLFLLAATPRPSQPLLPSFFPTRFLVPPPRSLPASSFPSSPLSSLSPPLCPRPKAKIEAYATSSLCVRIFLHSSSSSAAPRFLRHTCAPPSRTHTHVPRARERASVRACPRRCVLVARNRPRRALSHSPRIQCVRVKNTRY